MLKSIHLIIGGLILLSGMLKANDLAGAGATLPYPLYQSWFASEKIDLGVSVNYEAIGSQAGYEKFKKQSVDFCGSDIYLTPTLIEALPTPNKVIQIPVLVTGIVFIVNLPEIQDINIDVNTLTQILTGEITRWNDEQIQTLNKTVSLPDLTIIPILRKGQSGTTYVLSEYMIKVSEQWRETIGLTADVSKLTGIRVHNDEALVQTVRQVTGSIAFTSYGHVKGNTLVRIQNKFGKWVLPSKESIEIAVQDIGASTIFCSNTAEEDGYPITTLSWLIMYQEQAYNNRKLKQARDLKQILHWVLTEGQTEWVKGYTALPMNIRDLALDQLTKFTYEEKSF